MMQKKLIQITHQNNHETDSLCLRGDKHGHTSISPLAPGDTLDGYERLEDNPSIYMRKSDFNPERPLSANGSNRPKSASTRPSSAKFSTAASHGSVSSGIMDPIIKTRRTPSARMNLDRFRIEQVFSKFM